MTKIFSTLGLFFIAFLNGSAQQNHTQPASTRPAKEIAKTISVTKQLQELYADYIGIKEALVAGEHSSASNHANALTQTASLISYRDLSEGNINALRKDASAIADAKDIKLQRKAFSNLSNNMTALAGQFKLSDNPVYQQYCPMAKAYWLSNEKEIRNPYYGSSMLNCGSVNQTF